MSCFLGHKWIILDGDIKRYILELENELRNTHDKDSRKAIEYAINNWKKPQEYKLYSCARCGLGGCGMMTFHSGMDFDSYQKVEIVASMEK